MLREDAEMKKHQRAVMLTLAAVTFLHFHTVSARTPSTSASSFTITDLGTLGGTESFADAINDRGEVVGLSRLSGDRALHTFVYRRRTMTDLSPLNSGSIIAGPSDINNKGQIASGVIGGDGVYYPAIYDDDTGITILGSLGTPTWYGFSGTATSVNNRGQAVGYSYIDGETRHAFLYSDGVMTDLGSTGGYSAALGINDSGQAAGFSA